ncbi:ATP-dependent helicase BRM [Olea europaea subsp. europaea]|uniref:ATP-dependent helicase BRM n=1 Tax=Olea europaea subsp. europaea TaxID=158383 RepID=A0A8S0U348_OLEEU|nr:ATP-dependent helicase BRM [Olea europaea subsp. europaea]
MMAQLIQLMQAQMAAQQKANESNAGAQSASMSKHQVSTTKVANESSSHGNSSVDVSGRFGYSNSRQTVGSDPPAVISNATIVNSSGNNPVQQFSLHGRENQLPPRHPTLLGNPRPPTNSIQVSVNLGQGVDNSLPAKNWVSGSEIVQVQHARQLNRSPSHSSNDGDVVNSSTPQGGPHRQMCQQHIGFTKQQLHVLKAQILAFRRLKKGDGTLPRELLQAVAPPLLELQIQQIFPPPGTVNKDGSAGENLDGHARHVESSEKGHQVVTSSGGLYDSKEEVLGGVS